jgi:hypothetical protein
MFIHHGLHPWLFTLFPFGGMILSAELGSILEDICVTRIRLKPGYNNPEGMKPELLRIKPVVMIVTL